MNVNVAFSDQDIAALSKTIAAEVIKQSVISTPVAFPSPSLGTLYVEGDWKNLLDRWSITCSPETMTGSNVSNNASIKFLAPNILRFQTYNVAKVGTAGARLLLGKNRSWGDNKSWFGKTVEFFNLRSFPVLIPNIYGNGGWQIAGWQFKNSAAAGANPGMAMCIEVIDGKMHYWLQGNKLEVVRKDNFPAIPIGEIIATRLLVHFDSDPLKGWMRLEYANDSLEVKGANMAPDGGVGVYNTLYGMFDGIMDDLRTVVTVL